jgi:putative salt-induced outer membrane protein
MYQRIALLLALTPALAMAEHGWTGAGELGLALSRGNSNTESLHAKLGLNFQDAAWKHALRFAALRQRGETARSERLELIAKRYELNASSAWNWDERRFATGSLRYENDDFAPYTYQAIGAIGVGWYFIREEATEWLLEGGPGYRRFQDVATGETDGEGVLRAKMAYQRAFNASTSFENVLLVESGSDNTFAQNNASVSVQMNARLALKAGLEIRHNSEVAPGLEQTDRLFTTNLVYRF